MSDGLRHSLEISRLLFVIVCAHLLAQEVTDLNGVTILLDNAVDGEMGIDSAHFVAEALHRKSGLNEDIVELD